MVQLDKRHPVDHGSDLEYEGASRIANRLVNRRCQELNCSWSHRSIYGVLSPALLLEEAEWLTTIKQNAFSHQHCLTSFLHSSNDIHWPTPMRPHYAFCIHGSP